MSLLPIQAAWAVDHRGQLPATQFVRIRVFGIAACRACSWPAETGEQYCRKCRGDVLTKIRAPYLRLERVRTIYSPGAESWGRPAHAAQPPLDVPFNNGDDVPPSANYRPWGRRPTI